MNAISCLLTYLLIGCRNACDVGDAARAHTDLLFSMAVAKAIKSPAPQAISEILEGLVAWEQASSGDTTGTQQIRLPMYKTWAVGLQQDCTPLHLWKSDSAASVIERIITCAQKNAEVAIANGDLRRCAIELDHVHNLPYVVGSDSKDRFSDFLQHDKAMYLERLSKDCGSVASASGVSCFGALWQEASTLQWTATMSASVGQP